MENVFIADKVTCEVNMEENYYLIGFSDNGDNPDKYVVLQRAFSFEEQDVELGMNTYYFEYSDQSHSGYGICKRAEIRNGSVHFELKDKVFADITSIKITFSKDALETDWMDFKDIFDRIFSDSTAVNR